MILFLILLMHISHVFSCKYSIERPARNYVMRQVAGKWIECCRRKRKHSTHESFSNSTSQNENNNNSSSFDLHEEEIKKALKRFYPNDIHD